MPFKSEKQRRYMWANHPDIAQRWSDEEKVRGKDEEEAEGQALRHHVRRKQQKRKNHGK